MADELSFEEFRAIEKRKRVKLQPKDKEASKRTEKEDEDAELEEKLLDINGKKKPKKTDNKDKGLYAKFGLFLEMHEMQAAVCILLILDTYAAFYVATGALDHIDSTSVLLDIWHRGLKSFSTFCLFFFVIEIAANIVAFNFSIVGHFGYLVDVMVIGWQVFLESEGQSKAYKLLNLFRLWRVLRLFLSMLDIERGLHDNTKDLLTESLRELEETKEKLNLMEGDIEREKDARTSVEEMLQNYKEEVDTLNEALKIAAMDIAEVAEAEDDFFSSDDDESEVIHGATGEKIGEDGSYAGSSVGVDRDSNKNKEELYRLAMSGSASAAQKKATLVVHDDGTFESK